MSAASISPGSRLILVYQGPVSEKFAASLPRTAFGAWLVELPIHARLFRFAARKTMRIGMSSAKASVAMAFFDRAISACRGDRSITVAFLHRNAADCALIADRLESAQTHLQEALAIFCELPPTHVGAIPAAISLRDVMLKRSRQPAALAFFQQLRRKSSITPRPHPFVAELEAIISSLS